VEIRQIQSFVTITQTGSFSGAAQLLGYSQSAITVQIRLLEEELGVRLFDRMGKKIGLTSQGKRFLLCADEILKQVQMAGELKNTGSSSYRYPDIHLLFKVSSDSAVFQRAPSQGSYSYYHCISGRTD